MSRNNPNTTRTRPPRRLQPRRRAAAVRCRVRSMCHLGHLWGSKTRCSPATARSSAISQPQPQPRGPAPPTILWSPNVVTQNRQLPASHRIRQLRRLDVAQPTASITPFTPIPHGSSPPLQTRLAGARSPRPSKPSHRASAPLRRTRPAECGLTHHPRRQRRRQRRQRRGARLPAEGAARRRARRGGVAAAAPPPTPPGARHGRPGRVVARRRARCSIRRSSGAPFYRRRGG